MMEWMVGWLGTMARDRPPGDRAGRTTAGYSDSAPGRAIVGITNTFPGYDVGYDAGYDACRGTLPDGIGAIKRGGVPAGTDAAAAGWAA